MPAKSDEAVSTRAKSQDERDERDEDSSVHSQDVTLSRIDHFPFLPSVSSSANFKKLVTKRHLFQGLSSTARDISATRGGEVDSPHARQQTRRSARRHLRGRSRGQDDLPSDPPLLTPPPLSRILTPNDEPHLPFNVDDDEATSYDPSNAAHDGQPFANGNYKSRETSGMVAGFDSGDGEFPEITGQWARLRHEREAIKSTLASIEAEQKRLLDLRHTKSTTTGRLRVAVRNLIPQFPHLGTLLYEDEKADLEYQTSEVELTELIGKLANDEANLELQERKFFSAVAQSDTHSVSEAPVSRKTSRESLRGILAEREEDIHPLFREMQEAFADLELAKEYRANLSMKKAVLESDDKDPWTEDDEEFLSDFPSLVEEADLDVERWTKVGTELEMECRKKEVMPPNTPFLQEGYGLDPVFEDDIDLEDDRLERYVADRPHGTALAHHRYSLLLSNPAHLLRRSPETAAQSLRVATSLPVNLSGRQKFIEQAQKERGIETLLTHLAPTKHGQSAEDDWKDKKSLVDRWLLHILRQSALEVGFLANTFQGHLKILNFERWQRDVLFFWSRDDTDGEISYQDANGTHSTKAVKDLYIDSEEPYATLSTKAVMEAPMVDSVNGSVSDTRSEVDLRSWNRPKQHPPGLSPPPPDHPLTPRVQQQAAAA